MMPLTVSPQKRKCNEYHDPDYVRTQTSPTKKLRCNDIKMERSEYTNSKSHTIFDIISQEFKNEITFKKEQLSEVERRLDQGRALLDRLRLAIISEYYQKQELNVSMSNISAIRGKGTLFEKELHGPQFELHPSLKKLLGKKSAKILEIANRPLPERAAAQNALTTMRTVSDTQRRQERQLQQIIKDKGLVIDHSKEKNEQLAGAIAALQQTKSQVCHKPSEHIDEKFSNYVNNSLPSRSRSALNATRLNNKTKQVIIIGNTSTFIGGEGDNLQSKNKMGLNELTHKWLVYVQPKNPEVPLDDFIKKVRFHLHPSYRPNDIVDVKAPPFQIARRGWGEFPMRIQLFFHDHLQQKPVQLIHNLVLDRTLSGMHTLGAETTMEIWIRTNYSKNQNLELLVSKETVPGKEESASNESNKKPSENDDMHANNAKPHVTFSIQNKVEADDCLFGLLDKADSTDLRNMDSTVVKSEPVENISTNINEISYKIPQHIENSLKIETSKVTTEMPYKCNSAFQTKNATAFSSENKTITSALPLPNNNKNEVTIPLHKSESKGGLTKANVQKSKDLNNTPNASRSMQLTTPMIMKLTTSSIANSQNVTNSFKNNKNIMPLSRVGTFMPLKIKGTNNITPLANSPVSNLPIKSSDGKTVLQKKLVKLVDAEGKIKLMQVFVATTRKPQVGDVAFEKSQPGDQKATPEAATSVRAVVTETQSIALKRITSKAIDATNNLPRLPMNGNTQSTSNTVNSKNTNTPLSLPKQMVFQKEGKLFIIDPLQMKLKQEQKKQVSLLKPQTILHRKYPHQTQVQKVQSTLISDHDYTSTLTNAGKDAHFSYNPVKTSGISNALDHFPEVHLGIRQTRAKASSTFELLQQQRIQFEKDFLEKKFHTMRSAVDYILRHLPLIAPKNSLAAAFSFVNNSYTEFNALTVLKQRACEWLRAKYVTRFIRNHKYLIELNMNNKERFWSTREVLIYARYHAFSPKMKSFDLMSGCTHTDVLNTPSEAESSSNVRLISHPKLQIKNLQQEHVFSQHVKTEIESEKPFFQYESVTPIYHITTWLDGALQKVVSKESVEESSDELIDIVSVPVPETCRMIDIKNPHSNQPNYQRESTQQYLPIPAHLENTSLLVSDICRDYNIQLQPEKVVPDVVFPLTQAIMSQCLNVFIEKLVRSAIACKHSSSGADILNLTVQDIGKILLRHTEFDFLTNKSFGTCKNDGS
uniref:YEATS domain-containing protein 2 n=2 Tax=Ceratitis capitata TaxID=7213 RepID=W8BQD5_CERCA